MTLKIHLLSVYNISTQAYAKGISPVYMTAGAACADIATPLEVELEPMEPKKARMLLAFEIPEGHKIVIYPRSSLLIKHKIIQPVSIIDEDFTSEIHVPLVSLNNKTIKLPAGMRIAQIELVKCGERPVSFTQYTAPRGQTGFGTTGDI